VLGFEQDFAVADGIGSSLCDVISAVTELMVWVLPSRMVWGSLGLKKSAIACDPKADLSGVRDVTSVVTEFMVSVAGVEGRLLRVIQKQTSRVFTLYHLTL
jgi:hypothetical protein